MSHSQQVEVSAGAVRKLWEKHGIKAPLRFVAFCLSLLPIPVIAPAAQALDRHLSDKAFDGELGKVWARIEALNDAASKVETLEDAIAEIAKTVSTHGELESDVRSLIRRMGTHQKEFLAIAEDGGYQQFVNSLVMAESAYFIAKSGSTSTLENTTVSADRTVLHTTGGSKNFVDGTTFQGIGGSVSMHGMRTEGQVTVSGSGVGLGPGSALVFGGNPFIVNGTCPFCSAKLEVDRRRLAGFAQVTCPTCMRSMPFHLPPQ
ncbi:hypothetical protein [Variovorax sp. YR752]|uniref:hypothetical protein n=1 Tax=Variovorax sp. YR752 TaxID=1884383 RepID=UPI0031377B72